MRPYFSIIIPVFNGEARLGLTLDSVCRQLFRDFEIVVVDDGSTDNTSGVVAGYCKEDASRVHYFYKENGGVSSARNLGITKATGIFVTFLDSDDFLDENYLKRMHDVLEGTEHGWACCINKENGKVDFGKFTYGGERGLLEYILGGGNLPQTACWTLRKSFLVESGILFREDISYTEDYNFFCKYLYYTEIVKGTGIYLKEPLVNYILRNGSLCQRERRWLDIRHLTDDFVSTKDIYQYVNKIGGEGKVIFQNLLLRRLKKKYLYNLWGILLLGSMSGFKCLRQMYVADKKAYSLDQVKLGLKYLIWELATRPGICYATLLLRPYKRFQRFRRRKKNL